MQGIIEKKCSTPCRFAVTYFLHDFRYIEHFKSYNDAATFVYAIAGAAKDVLIWDGLKIVWGCAK